jgi:hypothetical protein
MSAVTIQQMADRIAGLMEERLGVRGKGLSEKMRRGGRLLPRSVRAQAKELAELSEKSKNPKLLVQIDQTRVATCYDTCLRYLSAQRHGSARLRMLLSIAATLALGFLVLAGVFLLVQQMKGAI